MSDANPSPAFDHTLFLSEVTRNRIRQQPDDARLHYEAGDEHRQAGRPEAALAAFETAARLAPTVAVAQFQVGNANYALGRYEAAAAAYLRSQELEPQADTANNLGNTYAQLNRLFDAVQAFEAAVKLNPEMIPAYINLGQAQLTRKKYLEAMNALMPALSRNPRHAKGQALLSETLFAMGNFESAADCYARAVESSPDDVDLRTAFGVALTRVGRFKQAAEQYTLALQQRPDDPILYNNLGEVHRSRGQITESLFCFYKALELKPDVPETHSNMILTMQYDASVSSEQLFNEGRFWAERHTAGITRLPAPQRNHDPERKLRVGFVSADLGRHPVGRFLEPVLKHRDPALTETYVYSTGLVDDEQTTQLRVLSDHWLAAVELSNDELAERIRADEIDILIDLAGHTAEHRLLMFAAKPAPVQASWAGFSGTTGVKEIDYVIADRWVVPKDEERYFTERVVRLPNCYVPYTPPLPDVPVAPLPAATNRFITFGCFNNLAKVTPQVVQLWAEVLRAVPNSRLFLKTRALGDEAIREAVTTKFGEHLIAPERLRLEGAAPRSELLAAYGEVDIGLDPFPFNGGITTLESLWQGVPVVSLRGNRFVGHATESFLQNAKLGDWVAPTRADYLSIAQAKAGDFSALAQLRSGLRSQMESSGLASGESYVRDFEAAIRTMWREWCAG